MSLAIKAGSSLFVIGRDGNLYCANVPQIDGVDQFDQIQYGFQGRPADAGRLISVGPYRGDSEVVVRDLSLGIWHGLLASCRLGGTAVWTRLHDPV